MEYVPKEKYLLKLKVTVKWGQISIVIQKIFPDCTLKVSPLATAPESIGLPMSPMSNDCH